MLEPTDWSRVTGDLVCSGNKMVFEIKLVQIPAVLSSCQLIVVGLVGYALTQSICVLWTGCRPTISLRAENSSVYVEVCPSQFAASLYSQGLWPLVSNCASFFSKWSLIKNNLKKDDGCSGKVHAVRRKKGEDFSGLCWLMLFSLSMFLDNIFIQVLLAGSSCAFAPSAHLPNHKEHSAATWWPLWHGSLIEHVSNRVVVSLLDAPCEVAAFIVVIPEGKQTFNRPNTWSLACPHLPVTHEGWENHPATTGKKTHTCLFVCLRD